MPSPAPPRHHRLGHGAGGLGEPFLRQKLLEGGLFFGGIAALGAAIAGTPVCRAVGIPVAALCFVLAAVALVTHWPARAQWVAGIAALAGAVGVICWVVAR